MLKLYGYKNLTIIQDLLHLMVERETHTHPHTCTHAHRVCFSSLKKSGSTQEKLPILNLYGLNFNFVFPCIIV